MEKKGSKKYMKSKKEIAMENKQSLRELENSYVNNILDNLDALVQQKKEELTNKLVEYKQTCKISRYDKNGQMHTFTNLSPVLIKSYFFKSINPISNIEPKYTAEKLGIVWELFSEMVMKINMDIGEFVPNMTTFCEFAGITSVTFNNYRNSTDENMRIIVQKIDDYCFNANVTLAQNGRLKERTTLYRMKSEQKRAETEQPQIHIHGTDEASLSAMLKRLDEINNFNKKKEATVDVDSKEV